MKNSNQNLTESSLILIISTAFVKIISAIFKIPLASPLFLGDIGFGYFSVAHDLFMPFYLLAISGLPVAVSQMIAENLAMKRYNQIEDYFYHTRKLFVIFGLMFSVFAALLSVPMVLLSHNAVNTLYSLIAIVPSIFLCFLISVYRGYFEGFCCMYPTAISKIIEAVVKLLFGLIVSFVVISLTSNTALAAAGATLSISFGTLLATFYLHFKFKKSNLVKHFTIQNDVKSNHFDAKTVFIVAVPLIVASLTSSIVTLIDFFAVKLQIDNANLNYITELTTQNPNITSDISTYLYGVRSKAHTLHNLVPTFTASLAVGAIPILTRYSKEGRGDLLQKTLSHSLKLINFLTFPISLGMLVLAKPIMSLLFSSESSIGYNILAVYAAGALFAGVCIPLLTILQIFIKRKNILINIGIAIIIKFAVSSTLASFAKINIYAAPIGTLVCYIYLAMFTVIALHKNCKNLNSFRIFFKPFFAAVLCSISAFIISENIISNFGTIIAILVGGIVYLLSIFFTKTFSKDELCELFKKG